MLVLNRHRQAINLVHWKVVEHQVVQAFEVSCSRRRLNHGIINRVARRVCEHQTVQITVRRSRPACVLVDKASTLVYVGEAFKVSVRRSRVGNVWSHRTTILDGIHQAFYVPAPRRRGRRVVVPHDTNHMEEGQDAQVSVLGGNRAVLFIDFGSRLEEFHDRPDVARLDEIVNCVWHDDD